MNKLEKKERKPRKRKIPKMPNKLIVIKNADKDTGNWMECWRKPKNRQPAHIIHPFRLLSLGIPGRGKSNCMKNIFLQHQSNNKPFKKLYIVCCDLDSKEWLDCEPTEVMVELPDPDFFDGEDKVALIIDDYEHERASADEKRRLSTLMRYTSTHRNLSIFVGYQSFFDCPNICRKTANVFLIYKPTSKLELTTIANRVGIDKDRLNELFKTKCSGDWDCVTIDKTIGTPYPLRKNIFEVLDDTV
tara:strand:+ start:249 stop:983 length:735 start_codon:yes stop_codon:yes gene_type:complete